MAKKVISDQQGQRKYPWQTTKIIGDRMATDGYGNIPLWVVPDVGEPRMIFPNTGEHYFHGASSFIEHPQFQKGGSSESTGVYIRPDKLNFNKEKLSRKLPKSVNDLVRENHQQYEQKNRQLEERDYAQYVKGFENPQEVNKYASLLDPTGAMDMNNIVEGGIRSGNVNSTDVAGAAANLIPGSKAYKTLKLLLNSSGKAGDVADIINQYEKGGEMKKPNNKGFNSLPKYVQKHIVDNMKQQGGEMDFDYSAFMQFGGATLMMGEDLPVLQVGGSKITPDQWHNQNIAAGNLPAATNGGYDVRKQIAAGQYPTYYNPKLYAPNPQTGGYTNKQYPNATLNNNPTQYGNPFIEYQGQTNVPIKQTAANKWIPMGPDANGHGSFRRGDIDEGDKRYIFQNGEYVPHDFTLPTFEKVPASQDSAGILPKQRFGGNPFTSSDVTKFLANYNKKFGGGNAPQGESLDDVLKQKNQEFVDYIANNTKAAMFREEAGNFQKGFAQMGQQVNPNQTDYINGSEAAFNGGAQNQFDTGLNNVNFGSNWSDFAGGPFGAYGTGNNGVPQYVTDMKYKYDMPSQKTTHQSSWTKNNTADALMAGVQGVNSMFNKYYSNQQNKFNQDKMTIENTAGTSYGSRGDYDVNSGNFRPDKKVAPKYKKGGQYSMDAKTIQDLISQGYELEFLD